MIQVAIARADLWICALARASPWPCFALAALIALAAYLMTRRC